MKMTMTKSAFEMPDGKYLARFDGVTMREDKPGEKPRPGQDGKPLPPAMTWDFVIVEGGESGKKADKLSGRIPTPKSACGKMLAAITDQILKDGTEVDLEAYIGKLYRITIIENRVTDNPAPVRVYDQVGATVPGKPPPPPSKRAKPAEPTDDSQWQLYDEPQGEYVQMTGKEVRAYFATRKLGPESVYVAPIGSDEQKVATEYGFDPVPF